MLIVSICPALLDKGDAPLVLALLAEQANYTGTRHANCRITVFTGSAFDIRWGNHRLKNLGLAEHSTKGE